MRQRTEGRLEQIADAALRAFSRGGLRQTQVADVAREAALSAGTLYLYAEGKDALFGLALRRAIDAMPAEGETLPIRAPAGGELRDLLAGAVARRFRWPAL